MVLNTVGPVCGAFTIHDHAQLGKENLALCSANRVQLCTMHVHSVCAQLNASSCINPNALAEAMARGLGNHKTRTQHAGFTAWQRSNAWGLESGWTTNTKTCPRALPRLLGRARLVLAPPSRAPRPCGARPPGLGPAARRLRGLLRLRCAARAPRRLQLAARLAEGERAAGDGVGGQRGVVGVEALLLQTLPGVALQPPPRPVLPPRTLPRPLLARPELSQAARLLLAQPQLGKGPAARCRTSSHSQGVIRMQSVK